MNKKMKKFIVAMLGVVAALFTLGGCSFGITKDDILQENNLTAQVTYFANGGLFENNTNKKEIYYPAGNPALNIGAPEMEVANAKISYADHELDGWYYVVLDVDGSVMYEDLEKTKLLLGERVDFSVALQEGDCWYIAAKWNTLQKVDVKLMVFDGNDQPTQSATVTTDDGLSYSTGSVVQQFSFENGEVKTATLAPFKAQDNAFTFVQFYADEACTQNVQWPILRDETKDGNISIYAKYLTGTWKILKTAKDVEVAFEGGYDRSTGIDFGFSESFGYYLVNNVDCSGTSVKPISETANSGYAAKFYGNGYTISNLKVEMTYKSVSKSVSLFGQIKSAAKICDLTLDNLQIKYTCLNMSTLSPYLAFTSIENTASVKNVTLSGVMTLDKSDKMQLSGTYDDAWKYGGYTNAEYEALYAGQADKGFIVNCTLQKA